MLDELEELDIELELTDEDVVVRSDPPSVLESEDASELLSEDPSASSRELLSELPSIPPSVWPSSNEEFRSSLDELEELDVELELTDEDVVVRCELPSVLESEKASELLSEKPSASS
ncbi:hypothetical protein [Crateriforma conspicua]|uniref:hypothetical protein n=1 Tax=Crateriforma conspicua TaxID=2527996 RepID=UPI001E3221D2|nr:hypothetical protein [Crateriforma conspicua]